MRGLFKIYALGATPKSKNDKYGYTFINGDKQSEHALFDRPTVFQSWTTKKLDVTFMQQITAEIDVQSGKDGGQFCKLLSIVDPETGEQVEVE